MTTWLLAALVALTTSAAAANEELDAAFEKDVLIVESGDRGCHRFDIYLALDDQQRARGLMHVRKLPATTGMLFAYGDEKYISMWMKDTYISLDMVFARADGSVSSVARNTEPLSLRSVRSAEPVSFVLELNAGTAERFAIDETSRLYWEPAHGIDE